MTRSCTWTLKLLAIFEMQLARLQRLFIGLHVLLCLINEMAQQQELKTVDTSRQPVPYIVYVFFFF